MEKIDIQLIKIFGPSILKVRIPETILIDSELKILKKYIGPLNINDVNEIRKIVKK